MVLLTRGRLNDLSQAIRCITLLGGGCGRDGAICVEQAEAGD